MVIERCRAESERLQNNVDFWKEKVDSLIKEKKELLDSQAKIYKQLASL